MVLLDGADAEETRTSLENGIAVFLEAISAVCCKTEDECFCILGKILMIFQG